MSEENETFETIHSRPAKSGQVSYGDSILLHDSSRKRVLFVPFFVPHSDHRELAIKIVTYVKTGGFAGPVENKSISLGEQSSRKLLHALRTHLQVAETGEDGSYILVRVAEGTAQLGEHEPSKVARALTRVLGQPEIVEHLQQTELSSALLDAFRGAIRLSEMRTAVATLRENLDAGECDERIYQEWCEKHSWAFGNAYVVGDVVRNISISDRLDLLLPTVIAGYRDLVELKRPDMDVLLYDPAHRNFYFSADVSKAVGQCHRYLDVLHEVAANGLLDHPEIVAYHPRATIVIGRSAGWEHERLKALHGLNGRLSGIMIMTYDQLLAQGERLVEMLSPGRVVQSEPAEAPNEWCEFDDDPTL
ncbi:MAG: Shedu anti-phage system protein SduA domain-containing protein [Candidatus Acidiferrum sp.]